MAPIANKLAALAAEAQKLNTESDKLNEVIEGLEDQLQQLQVGVSVWLDSDVSFLLNLEDWSEPARDDDAVTWSADCMVLGYTKLGNAWRIAVKSAIATKRIDGYSEEYSASQATKYTALVDAPRAIRVEAAAHLESLVEALTERVKTMLKGVASAQALIKK